MVGYIDRQVFRDPVATRAMRATCLGILALLAYALPASAQEIVPRVVAEQGLRFALIERSETITVSPETDSAALFAIWGVPLEEVTLGVAIVDPVGRNEHSMAIVLDPQSCIASADGGVTWQSLDLTTGACTLQFGEATAGFEEAVIFVRIGGTIASADTQRRGEYSGALTLSATYAPGRVRTGIPAIARRIPGPSVEARTPSGPDPTPRRELEAKWTRTEQ